MTNVAMSRRYLRAAGAGGALAGASGLAAVRWIGRGSSNQDIIRRWYAAWQQTDWGPVGALMADDFTFTSAAGDDHIDKSTFKSRCWESQIGFVQEFELEQVFGSGNEALVKYLCRTKNGRSFRNVEYLTFRDRKLASIECYFGEQNSFPSAVSTKQKG